MSEGEEGGEGGSGEPWQCHEERMGGKGEGGGGGGGTRPLADTRTLVYEVGKRKEKGFLQITVSLESWLGDIELPFIRSRRWLEGMEGHGAGQ